MALYKGKYRVQSTRLPCWDYATAGWYFVTICTFDRKPFFGWVSGDKMRLSPVGKTAHRFWQEIPDHFPHVNLDEFIVMPNHVHGIVLIDGDGDTSIRIGDTTAIETRHVASLHLHKHSHNPIMPKFGPLKKGSLSKIIQAYKSAVTRWARRDANVEFAWQTRFYDHIIRDDRSLLRIQRYIQDNPMGWVQDRHNPANLFM